MKEPGVQSTSKKNPRSPSVPEPARGRTGGQSPATRRTISPELLQGVTERVYQLLQNDLLIEWESVHLCEADLPEGYQI